MYLPTVCDLYWAAGFAEAAMKLALASYDLPDHRRVCLEEAVVLLEHGRAVR